MKWCRNFMKNCTKKQVKQLSLGSSVRLPSRSVYRLMLNFSCFPQIHSLIVKVVTMVPQKSLHINSLHYSEHKFYGFCLLSWTRSFFCGVSSVTLRRPSISSSCLTSVHGNEAFWFLNLRLYCLDHQTSFIVFVDFLNGRMHWTLHKRGNLWRMKDFF